ncbi:RNA recognition domain-containing protein [Colletotrichum karsti]|uniref:RNA recognition domain-containing protein n=1 Tax=Colletotrichum karsti TaxID=1095194 RepID=A0A9P6I735_9PEZI|nr:RNA recognition domain-containing protein [Colletotrichum karsti]KAF9875196.1 RNA recognition domain-containing protein [Colletotrichum karsti]
MASRSRSPSRDRYRSRPPSGLRFAASFAFQIANPATQWKIVVERLTKNVNEGHLEEIFGQFGPIKDLDLPINRTYGTNRGTAYILYDHEADAEDAIAHMHEAQVDGAVINVSIVLPRRKLSPPPPMARRGAGYDPRPPPLGARGGGRQSGAPYTGASGPGSFGLNGPRRGASPPPGRRGPRSDTYRPRSLSRSPSKSPMAAPPSRGGGNAAVEDEAATIAEEAPAETATIATTVVEADPQAAAVIALSVLVAVAIDEWNESTSMFRKRIVYMKFHGVGGTRKSRLRTEQAAG